ncbi:MAG: hypothetical protein PVF83_05960 [Anaerolineales bacterium]
MYRYRIPKILAFIIVLVLAQLACGANGNDNGATSNDGDSPDYSATEDALAKTQAALDAQKTEETQPPVATEPPVIATQPPEDEPFDYTTLQSGDLVYYTDFDSAGDWEDGWIQFPIPSSDNYSVYKQNGYLYFEVNESNLGIYAIPDFIYFPRNYADVLVEIFEENVGSTNLNNIGVICRASADGWYEFALLSGGEWFIYKATFSDNVINYQVLASGGISGFDYDSPHYVAGECSGDTLTIYIDAEAPKNGSVTDRSYREGQVGMFVYAREYAGVEVEIEDFAVVVP